MGPWDITIDKNTTFITTSADTWRIIYTWKWLAISWVTPTLIIAITKKYGWNISPLEIQKNLVGKTGVPGVVFSYTPQLGLHDFMTRMIEVLGGPFWFSGFWMFARAQNRVQTWVVVSNIFYFHPYLGEDVQFDQYFSKGLKPPTRNRWVMLSFRNVLVRGVMELSCPKRSSDMVPRSPPKPYP